MSWFSLRGAGSRREPPPKAVEAAENEPEVHRSLALPAFFTALARSHRANVLDLGAALGSNVERLSVFGCKLFIEDLYESKQSAGDGSLGPQFFSTFLAPPAATQFDFVLAWDLFDYLTRKELTALGARLSATCRPGALVFALTSIHKIIPAQPIRFRFHGQDELVYERRTTVDRPGPRFAPAELNAALQGFCVDRSFLLRHGIQEFLFEREGEAHRSAS